MFENGLSCYQLVYWADSNIQVGGEIQGEGWFVNSYYLWSGIGAIEDLEDVDNDYEARRRLQAMVSGHWTLWKREGLNARLLGVKLCDLGETMIFGGSS